MIGFSALLIGVPHYQSDDFPDISTVRNDLTQLRLALESSGYADNVRVFPDPAAEDPVVTAPVISRLIREACRDAPAGGVLFVYFSGHGVSYEGKDYLVPSDIPSLADALADPQYLVETDLSRHLKNCDARAVVFAVDACRETLDPGKGLGLRATPEFGRGAVAPEHKTRVSTIFGCDAEQYCYYSDELRMSLFTKALVTVLAPEYPARTLTEVVDSADKVLQTLVTRYKPGRFQRVHLLGDQGAGDIRDQVICVSGADPWRDAITASALWGPDRAAVQAEIDAAVAIATEVWKLWQGNVDVLPDDPWRDADHYRRCVAALDLLVPPGVDLSPAEILLLLTAPLLAEAMHAAGIDELAKHRPLDLAPGLSDEPTRRELEAVHSAHARVWQKATALAEPRPADADALALWLAHRCVFRQVGLWQRKPVTALSARLAEVVEKRQGFRAEQAAVIRGAASMLGAGAEDLTVFLSGQAQGDRAGAAKAKAFPVRGKLLALLLGVAGAMAFDLRRLGEVVVDHIGIHDPLEPAALRQAVCEARWSVTTDRTTLLLAARCVHPATHLAMQEVADAIQQQLQAVRHWLDETGGNGIEVLTGLPVTVNTADLKAQADVAGRPVYETPLLQFRLAHHEIRDLLMGARLYGDPALAIRELYQNALDACRYRSLRARFRNQPYQGRIRFLQDRDADGREFIECTDNGVGMGRNELENTFSKAGRRFVNSTDFLWEQAEWLQKDESLRLWANSRFGIGVFSYFMLADEIFIETARVDRTTNTPRETLHVHISSSGSLFRITTTDAAAGPDDVSRIGGTRVRLYLRQMAEPISCVDKLRQMLWYSEFDVEARFDSAFRRWPADQLCPPEPYPWMQRTGEIWWVATDGRILADGIVCDETPFGYVVNLRDGRSPQLSVDRNRLESWDQPWVRSQLGESLAGLAHHPDLTHGWVQCFADEEPEVAEELVAELVRDGVSLPNRPGDPRSAPFERVGLWPLPGSPAGFYSPVPNLRVKRWDLYWNISSNLLDSAAVALWRSAGVSATYFGETAGVPSDLDEAGFKVAPVSTDGQPVLKPADLLVLVDRSGDGDWATSEGGVLTIVKLSRRTGLPVAGLLRRVRRFAIHGAVPAPAGDGSWERPADDLDVQVAGTSDEFQSLLPALATMSHKTGLPLALICERMRAVQRLRRESPIAFRPDPDYVCDSGAVSVARLIHDGLTRLELIHAAIELGETPARIAARVASLASTLGFRLATDLSGLPDHAVAPELRAMLGKISMVAERAGTEDVVDVTALLRMLGSAGGSPGELLERLAPFQVMLGVRLIETTEVEPAWPQEDPFADLTGLHQRDRVVLSADGDGIPPYYLGERSPAYMLGLAQANDETIEQTTSRLVRLGRRFPVSAPDFDWGGMWSIRLPSSLGREMARYQFGLSPEPVRYLAGALVHLAGHTETTVSEVIQTFAALLTMSGRSPVAEQAYGQMAFVPDEVDVLVALVPNRWNLADQEESANYRWDALHVVRIAGRLGRTIGDIGGRVTRLAPLLDDPAPEVPEEAADIVPDWRDVILLTPELDGQQLITDDDITDDWIRLAAREADTTEEDVRRRLARYATYCGFTAPTIG
ncbi:Caspase domain-containing protein [Actinoplanes regularis]|uniref:Caspase domain-containing protein n=1 Tax=Actinoplanes regularis TaxID=52697 RepID=A0A238ZL57_9ACTN|nr:hypothetical protein Are01nite_40980 [Actinoplanes regularis]SNR83922.1 Caspase domain-containing protein [Actinoplanes regularis]